MTENFNIGTKFQNITKKRPLLIFGESGFAPNRTFDIAEISEMTNSGYTGFKGEEQELEAKLQRRFIEILKQQIKT